MAAARALIRTLDLGGDGLDGDERAEREALEHGFYFGRVVWFDPYPFDDELVLEPRTARAPRVAGNAAGGEGDGAPASRMMVHTPSLAIRPLPPLDAVDADAATAPAHGGAAVAHVARASDKLRPRQRWRRRVAWRWRRLRADFAFYLCNHHFVLAPLLAHPLCAVGRLGRTAVLVSAAGVALGVQLLLEADVGATVSQALAELVASGELQLADFPELPALLQASSLFLAISAGATAVTASQLLAKALLLPPCARRAEVLRAAMGGDAADGAARAPAVAAGAARERSCVRRLSRWLCCGTSPCANRCCDGCGCGWCVACAACALAWARARSVELRAAALALLGVTLGGACVAVTRHRALLCLNALASLVQAALFQSVLTDALAFAAVRHTQLRRFGRLDVVRAHLYPHGLGRPSAETLRRARRGYEPLPDGPLARAARAPLASHGARAAERYAPLV
ncbi:hypothetical protein KFE25_004765 [Diacronema lutheri]|uniref:Uncharacterized protein n=1 Tax=Diacronema lutheri TaxID=2081491 RepID=A0A8J6C7H7_DIALT|nr:hypothetical protein KFE25_004765 [Diacronema lutheri]